MNSALKSELSCMKAKIFLILFLIQNIVIGQNIDITNNGLINRLSQEKNNIEISHSFIINKIIPQEKNFRSYNQLVIKNNKGTYILVDGTGRVYKQQNRIKDTIKYERIDSTHFYGYNASAITFSCNDTLYSFGGGGFWINNGHLRFYNEKFHEWDIIPLNKEVPTSISLHYFDSLNSDLYYLQIPYLQHSTNQMIGDFELYKLNLKSKINSRLGKLNVSFQKFFPITTDYLFIKLNSLGCVLLHFNSSNQFLVDIVNNKVYKLNNFSIQKIFSGNSKHNQISNAFELNNWLYYTRSNDTTMQLDSVRITMDDFIPIDTPFYEPESRNQNLFAGTGLGILILIGTSVYFYRRKKELSLKDDNNIESSKFKSIELDLIEKIYKKTTDGKSYSVEDINSALGLSKKSLEIQKKIRTETINRINHRFKLKFNTEEDLIERVRLEEDRRFYKYIINEENGKKALGI